MKFKILPIPSNLLRYLLKTEKKLRTIPVHYPSLSPFSNSNQIEGGKKRESSSAVTSCLLDRTISIRPSGRSAFFPRFPYRALAKNLLATRCIPGERIPGSAHNRASKDSREFRAVAPSPGQRNRAFEVSASSTGWNKKMGGALDVTGPDLGPGDQAARLGLRSVGPFPLPHPHPLSLSLSFFFLGCLDRGGTSGVRENKREREREIGQPSAACAATRGNIERSSEGQRGFQIFLDY